jgi:hypothetical protein
MQGKPAHPETVNPMAYPRAITLFTENFKNVRSWYENFFQLPLAGFDARSITFATGRPSVIVRQMRSPVDQLGSVLIDYHVPDIDALYSRLEAQELTFEKPLTNLRRLKEFIVVSPDGYRFRVRGPVEPPGTQPARR